MAKNKNSKCLHNIKGYCYLGKSKYFSKRCNENCNLRMHYKSNNSCLYSNFYINFLKVNNDLVLKIKIPIDYDKLRKVIKNNIWTFQSTQKEKNITVQILLYDIESYIEFLFNDFDKNVYVKSSCLYIFLENVREITNNKTPYKQMKKKIKIKRTIKNKFGYIYLTISLDKDLVFSSVYKLFNKNKITYKYNDTKRKNINHKKEKQKITDIHSKSENNKQQITQKQSSYVKAIVLSNNRKCVYEEHTLIDIKAIIRVLTSKNEVVDVIVPAVHCKECNQYIILKTDFKSIKQKGTLLCYVIDRTPEYISKHKNSSYSGTESRVHSLGYNVIKQRYNYTFEQRKIILANIIENYEITQYEILSMLDTNIARKINMPNYADAVEKWQQDREFVANYKTGDIPEVIVEEIIIGRK